MSQTIVGSHLTTKSPSNLPRVAGNFSILALRNIPRLFDFGATSGNTNFDVRNWAPSLFLNGNAKVSTSRKGVLYEVELELRVPLQEKDIVAIASKEVSAQVQAGDWLQFINVGLAHSLVQKGLFGPVDISSTYITDFANPPYKGGMSGPARIKVAILLRGIRPGEIKPF